MNAKFILAAIAAICCVQGIAAASLSRAVTKDVAAFDLEDMDVDEVIERLSVVLDEALDDESEGVEGVSGSRNIITCATSVVGFGFEVSKAFKSLWGIHDLWWEWSADMATCAMRAQDKRATCEMQARTAAADRWVVVKAKLIDSGIDMLIDPIILYTNCTDLFA